VYVFECRYVTRWDGNEWRGRLIRARNELEFLLISQIHTVSWKQFLRSDVKFARKDFTPKSKFSEFTGFSKQNRKIIWTCGKKVHVAAKEGRRKSDSQLKIIKLIGPWDNQANYRYQSTIAPRRCVLPMWLHPRDFFTRMTNPINYRATEPTLQN